MEPRVVILAAGASSRLGEPKALVDLPGGRPVLRLVRAAREATGEDPLVVTGAHHGEIALALAEELGASRSADVLRPNPAWAAGRTGGVVLAARCAQGRDLCVLPVDHPRVGAARLRELFHAWSSAGSPERGWLAPGFRPVGASEDEPPRPGHPIVLGRALVTALEAFPPDRPLRDLRAGADPVWMTPTDDIAVVENLDHPEDLEEIRRADS